MTVHFYPPELPACWLVDGLGHTFQDGRLFAPMQNGPAKLRRQSSAMTWPYRMQTYISRDQYTRLLRFWHEDTAGGTLPFVIPDPLIDGHTLLTAEGEALETAEGEAIVITAYLLVRFGESPPEVDRVANGRNLYVTFNLDVLP